MDVVHGSALDALKDVSIRSAERSADPETAVEERRFDAFVRRHEARLRVALTATYGPVDGRVAAVDALSWAWEHWAEVQTMANPVGYLYRVGQSSTRRNRPRPIPIVADRRPGDVTEVHDELLGAITTLPEQQRTAVMLTHAFGWTVRDVARLMEIAPSTVQTHVARGLARLRQLLVEEQS